MPDPHLAGRLVCSTSHALNSLRWEEPRLDVYLRRLGAQNRRYFAGEDINIAKAPS